MSEVEKTIDEQVKDLRRLMDAPIDFKEYYFNTKMRKIITTVHAKAIASTEAKFRELAEKWSRGETLVGEFSEQDSHLAYAHELESLLTPCPQSRHDAGEKSDAYYGPNDDKEFNPSLRRIVNGKAIKP